MLQKVGTAILPLIFIITLSASVLAHDERAEGWYTVVDEAEAILLQTGLVVNVGDQFIDANNRQFEIFRVSGDIAYARLSGQAKLTSHGPEAEWMTGLNPPGEPIGTPNRSQRKIAFYYTHSDESYVKGDGAASKRGAGGVYDVGTAMKRELEKQNVAVLDDRTPHDPHDAAAYDRSRRTAVNLLQKGAIAVFDIHRDTAPAEAYNVTVANDSVSKIMFVVGRENPNMKANLGFAKHLKNQADKRYPGLIKGILIAKGKYNQDLSPRLLLIEVGTHKINKEKAKDGGALLAQVLPEALGSAPAKGPESQGGLTAIWWVVGIALVGAIAYIFLSTGSWSEAKTKLKKLFTKEIALIRPRHGPKSGE